MRALAHCLDICITFFIHCQPYRLYIQLGSRPRSPAKTLELTILITHPKQLQVCPKPFAVAAPSGEGGRGGVQGLSGCRDGVRLTLKLRISEVLGEISSMVHFQNPGLKGRGPSMLAFPIEKRCNMVRNLVRNIWPDPKEHVARTDRSSSCFNLPGLVSPNISSRKSKQNLVNRWFVYVQ